jgi:DNA helicase-2/ATP-dependent DNA helicase PcrA
MTLPTTLIKDSLADHISNLNHQQYAAVTHRGSPALVKALAGGGKTKTLTCRFAKLVIQDSVAPERILTLTFTRKAATEMVNRIKRIMIAEKKINPDEENATKNLWVGTFHALGSRILRTHGHYIGLEKFFTILEADEDLYLFKQIFKDKGLSTKKSKPSEITADNKSHPLAYHEQFAELYSKADNSNEDPLETIPNNSEVSSDKERTIIQEIIESYRKTKKEQYLVSYDDILIKWKELMEHPVASSAIREFWDHVLVDEYQDTNKLQESILQNLNTTEIFAVGDANQAIFSWRAANPENFNTFAERYENSKVFPLEINYRSTPQVLNAANEILESTGETLRLQANRLEGKHTEYLCLQDADHEARLLVKQIANTIKSGVAPEEICVLARTSMGMLGIERELNNYDIPYEKRGGTKITDRLEIRDCLAFARILLNNLDKPAWVRALKLFPRIGENKAAKIAQDWITAERHGRIGQGLDATTNLLNFIATLDPVKHDYVDVFNLVLSQKLTPNTPLRAFLDEIQKLWERIAPDNYANNNLEDRRANVIREIEAWKKEENLENLIERLALSKSEEEERLQNDTANGKRRIIISTIHSAKGLEWSWVAVIGAGDKQMPHPMAVAEGELQIEEERRLLYVAMTRAKDTLYVTFPKHVQINGQFQDQTQTQFLNGNFKELK